ncbi:MAG: GntR family transcriptional regulator [Planctomycetes bacterium]|nr:GntR family transcriptional regulator [Planctomycetota bacterium]
MLHFQVDPHSGVPVYRQVMDQLMYYIASGTLRAGDQLPSIRELSKNLRVNPTTVVKAYSELEHQGAIAMQHGKGAFVAEKAKGLSAHEREELLRASARTLAVEARQLGATPAQAAKILREEMERLQSGGTDERNG